MCPGDADRPIAAHQRDRAGEHAATGLITTEGFRDILHIARHKRPQIFSLQLDLPWQSHPLVPRERRLTVAERVAASGEVIVPLDEAAARAAVRRLVAAGVEAIAVCFLFSFRNPAHERRVGEIVAEEAPGVFVSHSHQVVAQYREYERFSTTALNAYIGPKTARYLERLSGRLAGAGVRADLRLMQSSGGAATLDAALRRPVMLLMSGPAGGLLGGIFVGKSAGFDNVVTLDVGGTSADIGVAPGGEVLYKHILDTRLGDYHAMVPMAQVDAIGAGGGSIAYVDSGGQFQVGPKSAGSDPGPCCYGRGGAEPTATDCMVAFGLIDLAGFLGGRLPLDARLAVAAVRDRLATRLGVGVEQAALGAIRILTHNMVQAIEINSVRRGYDPRDFALVAFGGGGPLFACGIARELGIPNVVIPPLPGPHLGARVADHRHRLRAGHDGDAVALRDRSRAARRAFPRSRGRDRRAAPARRVPRAADAVPARCRLPLSRPGARVAHAGAGRVRRSGFRPRAARRLLPAAPARLRPCL
jgi:N-methylhydantoinase A